MWKNPASCRRPAWAGAAEEAGGSRQPGMGKLCGWVVSSFVTRSCKGAQKQWEACESIHGPVRWLQAAPSAHSGPDPLGRPSPPLPGRLKGSEGVAPGAGWHRVGSQHEASWSPGHEVRLKAAPTQAPTPRPYDPSLSPTLGLCLGLLRASAWSWPLWEFGNRGRRESSPAGFSSRRT